MAAARKELGWDLPPFEIPADVAGLARGRRARRQPTGPNGTGGWRPAASAPSSRRGWRAGCDDGWLKPYLDALLANPAKVATRKASEMALEAINAAVPATIGGSADLTGSNNTKTKGLQPLTSDNYGGRYIYYGIREFGMAAAMNGMALHGGVLPYGGTFLVFSDYSRPAIRLGALMGAKVIHVMTHEFDRAWRGRADPPADRASAGACGRCRACTSIARPTRSRRPNAGRWRWPVDGPALMPVAAESAGRCGPRRRTANLAPGVPIG